MIEDETRKRVWVKESENWNLYNKLISQEVESSTQLSVGKESENSSGIVKVRNMTNSEIKSYPLTKNLSVIKLKNIILQEMGKKRRLSLVHNGKDLEDNVMLEKLLPSDINILNIMLLYSSQLMSVTRFKDCGPSWHFTSHSSYNESRFWSGSCDAIGITVDRAVEIAGTSAYAVPYDSNSSSEVEYIIHTMICKGGVERLYDITSVDSLNPLSMAKHTISSCGSNENKHVQLLFDEPTLIDAGELYTLLIWVYGPPGNTGRESSSEVKCEETGINFSFQYSSASNNGTSDSGGQIPIVYFYS